MTWHCIDEIDHTNCIQYKMHSSTFSINVLDTSNNNNNNNYTTTLTTSVSQHHNTTSIDLSGNTLTTDYLNTINNNNNNSPSNQSLRRLNRKLSVTSSRYQCSDISSFTSSSSNKNNNNNSISILPDSDPLIKACKKGDSQSVKDILDNCDSDYDRYEYVNRRDKAGSTSIFHTVWYVVFTILYRYIV